MSDNHWYEFHGHSGIMLRGTVPVQMSDFQPLGADGKPKMHIDRAVWVTSQCEAPKFGTVQSYDGAGISGGLLHNIAVLPATMGQGDLFALLGAMFGAAGSAPAVAKLKAALAAVGWTVAKDGALRDAQGRQVGGKEIRNQVAPPDGAVPQQGPQYDQALRWATLFHDAFSDASTHRVQIDFAARWLARGQAGTEIKVYQQYISGIDSPIHVEAAALPAAIDLAMCVYHCFSVNAPGPAVECLQSALPKVADAEAFALALVRALGTKKYGRWHDEPGDGGNRYDTTRKAVWSSGIWDAALAQKLVPKDL